MAKPPPGHGYMPALDGLRALAVLAVFAYHLRLPFVPGGFLGVDLFFVISGFLITMLLVSEAERTSRVRLGAFWIRRGRRLLPALVLMIAVICAVAMIVGRDLDVGLRRQVAGAAVYGSNWVQIASGDSYVETFQPALLTHLWSLAVEEQFYLIWPFVVVLLLSFLTKRQTRVLVVLAAAAASAVWMGFAYVPGGDPTRAYVGTDTHGFALLLGAALGLGMQVVRKPVRQRMPSRHRLLGFVGLVGYVVVVAGMLLLDDTGPATFRGGIVLVDIAAVAVVAAAAKGAGAVGVTFALPLLTWIGRRSYGIYLWHWPVIVIAERMLPLGTGMWVLVAVSVTVTMLAAEASWHLVEVPIRTLGFLGWLRRIRDQALGRPAGAAHAGTGPLSGMTVGLIPRPAARAKAAAAVSATGGPAAGPTTARRGLSVLGVAGMVSVLVLASYAVLAAPERSTLDEQLAAGQAALMQHNSTAQAGRPGPAAGGGVTTRPETRATQTSSAPESEPTTGTTGAPRTTAAGEPVTSSTPTTTKATTSTKATKSTKSPKPTKSTKPTKTTKATKPAKTTTPTKPTTAASPKPKPKPSPKPSPKPPAAPPADPVAGPVSAIGDSVMLSAAPDLLATFPHLAIDAVVSRQWWDLPVVVAQHVKAGDVGDVVVIGLGTNGTWSADEIRASLAPLGDRPVVLVNTFEGRDWQVDVNQQLQQVAAARPRTCIADWHSLVAANKAWIGYDGVHPNEAGRKGYADLLAKAVRACG